MNELDTRAERFLESIRAEGEAACAAIREETEREVTGRLDETRRAENARVERTLRFETERARTRANRDLSAARMAARAKLADQRQKIADETFAKAREQLAAFAAGDGYARLAAERDRRTGRSTGGERQPFRPQHRPAAAQGRQAARRHDTYGR